MVAMRQITTGILNKRVIRALLLSHLHGTCQAKLTLTLCLIKHHVMKHGAVDLQFHLFLTSEVEVSGHLHTADALPPGKEPPVPTEQGLGRPWAGLDAFGKNKIPCPCRESNNSTFIHPVA